MRNVSKQLKNPGPSGNIGPTDAPIHWIVVDHGGTARENRDLTMILLENITKEYDLPSGKAGSS